MASINQVNNKLIRINNISATWSHAQLICRKVIEKLRAFFGPWCRDRSQSSPCWKRLRYLPLTGAPPWLCENEHATTRSQGLLPCCVRTSTLPLGHRVSLWLYENEYVTSQSQRLPWLCENEHVTSRSQRPPLVMWERARYLSVTEAPPGCVRTSTLPLGHRGSPWLCENQHATS